MVIHILKNWGQGRIERGLGTEMFFDEPKKIEE
jgi:hypothetical protein